MRESKIAKPLQKRLDALGILHRRVSWIGRRGAPDIVAMGTLKQTDNLRQFYYAGEGFGTVWIETKPTGGEADDHQAREHNRMCAAGQTVLVINSLEDIDRWFPL